MKHREDMISECFLSLVNRLVEIIKISYANEKLKKNKDKFYVFLNSNFSKSSKLTTRKFFCSHFHSITFRLFCLRSIIPEQDETNFGDLQQISLRSSYRQTAYVIDMIRFNAQQMFHAKQNSFRKQDSSIGHQEYFFLKNGGIHHFHRNSYSKILPCFKHICKEYRLHGVWIKCLLVETWKWNVSFRCEGKPTTKVGSHSLVV